MTTEKKTIETDVETVIVDERKVTWSYSRKKNLGNYQSEDIGIYLTDHAPKSTKNVLKWASDKSEPVFNELKAQVWGALGLEFLFDELGVPNLDEVLVTPPTTQPAPVQPSPPVQQERAPGQNPSIAQPGVHAVTPTFCKDCGNQGLESFWDNRTQNDEKQAAGQKIGPDFKCKNCDGGNGKGKPLYRPGSYDYNQRVGAAPATMVPPTPPDDDNLF
jgi:hypothetical protein